MQCISAIYIFSIVYSSNASLICQYKLLIYISSYLVDVNSIDFTPYFSGLLCICGCSFVSSYILLLVRFFFAPCIQVFCIYEQKTYRSADRCSSLVNERNRGKKEENRVMQRHNIDSR
jgi:hypothetical protein